MFGSKFDVAELKSHEDIQAEFSDSWVHTPMVSRQNFSAQPDRSKPPYQVDVIFQWLPRDIHLGMEDSKINSRDPRLTALVNRLPYGVRRGDLWRRLATGETFEVTETNPDGNSGIEINLVECGRQKQ